MTGSGHSFTSSSSCWGLDHIEQIFFMIRCQFPNSATRWPLFLCIKWFFLTFVKTLIQKLCFLAWLLLLCQQWPSNPSLFFTRPRVRMGHSWHLKSHKRSQPDPQVQWHTHSWEMPSLMFVTVNSPSGSDLWHRLQRGSVSISPARHTCPSPWQAFIYYCIGLKHAQPPRHAHKHIKHSVFSAVLLFYVRTSTSRSCDTHTLKVSGLDLYFCFSLEPSVVFTLLLESILSLALLSKTPGIVFLSSRQGTVTQTSGQ